jgi:cytochrome c peroxidase
MLSKSRLVVLLIVSALALRANAGRAAVPQVPSLPTQAADYVQYSVGNLPAYFQNGPASLDNTPGDNLLTNAGATLGRVLFYDARLSQNNIVSCSSCHHQANGFSDTNQFSAGINGQLTTRHSMGLTDVRFYGGGRMFWDERAGSLEEQALVPIQSPTEMGSTLDGVVAKLNQTKFYPTLFQAAFGTPDATPDRVAKAISQFERSMVSYNSKYDDSLTGKQTLSPAEQAGEALFNGTARCASCHTTTSQSVDEVMNIGLDATITDPGAGAGRFKAPSLRNVAVRGRYMHDGRFSSLQEVVNFYSSQVIDNGNVDGRLTNPLQLNLSSEQIDDLVAFLNTLTDNTFLTSSLFSNPFVTLPGDYNGDGVVDAADYQVWRSNFGDTTSLVADGNGDGKVDTADYLLWRENMGRTWQSLMPGDGASISQNNVPEPAGLALGLLASTWLYFGRRGRRL